VNRNRFFAPECDFIFFRGARGRTPKRPRTKHHSSRRDDEAPHDTDGDKRGEMPERIEEEETETVGKGSRE
jgi:hypothetical protein